MPTSGVVDRVGGEIRHDYIPVSEVKGALRARGAGMTGDMVEIMGYPGLQNFAEKVGRLLYRIDPLKFASSLTVTLPGGWRIFFVHMQYAVSLAWE